MSYMINKNTLALISLEKQTQVYEVDKSFVLSETPRVVVSNNCILNGSTIEGRQKASAYLVNTNYKPPIVLNELENIILIPTHSIRNINCSWIILNNILKYERLDKKNIMLEFKNHKKVPLNISYSIFDKQVLRASRLESILRNVNHKKYL